MQIQINGISCMTLIGHHDYERIAPQELIIDVLCDLYDKDWQSYDTIENTLCFDVLLAYIKEVATQTNYVLLESFVQRLAGSIFDKFAKAKSLEIRVFKTNLCGVGAKELVVKLSEQRKFNVAIAIGSNHIYLPQQQLISAIEILGSYLDNIKVGGIYETKPYGFTEQPNFYNTAIVGTTTLMPDILFSKLKKLEKLMGKQEIRQDGPRIIDLDLVFFDNLIYENNFLKIPHVAVHERDFVLQPLVDIVPNLIHPVFNKTVLELLEKISTQDRTILNTVLLNNKVL